jgi:hypothetical protein
MIRFTALALSLLLTTAAFAQSIDPLRNVSGTTADAGATPWVTSGTGRLTFFHGFDAHLTYMSQTGPEEQENDIISTNWLAAGARLDLSDRAFVLARGRVSFEPYTIDDSYLQFFQYLSDQQGSAVAIDRMIPHDLFQEAGVQFGFRPSTSTLISVYGALVGQPALGALPAHLRASGVDFAEAPFAYDIQETYADATSVVTAGFSTRTIALEVSAFHDAMTTGDHTELETGDIDSQSARLTLMPSQNVSLQVSRGKLGEDFAERTVTSGSLSYAASMLAVTALWTRREYESGRVPETAYGFEIAIRGARNTFMARAEHVDRPAGFPFPNSPVGIATEEATHFTGGYLYDFISGGRYRLGLGVNIDYRTQTRHLEEVYGHKPQGIFTFVRFRTGA